jgi:hypothetical protein
MKRVEESHISEFLIMVPEKKRMLEDIKTGLINERGSEPGSSGSIVSGYGLNDRAIEVRSPAEAKGFFLYPLCPDRLWGPPSLLYNGYRGSFPRG